MALGSMSQHHELGVTAPPTPTAQRGAAKRKKHEEGVNPRTGHRLIGIR
jgi:hypothetical protein